MKKIFVLTAMFCLCFQANSVSAATPDFSGYWELDVSKSTLSDARSVESMIMRIVQTEKNLKVAITTRERKNDAAVTQVTTYNFDGSETTTDISSGASEIRDTRKMAITPDGKLNLNSILSIKDGAGNAMATKTNEIWELLDEGKTLKLTSYTETARGATNAELFFTKRREGIATRIGKSEFSTANGNEKMTRRISGGVLNGKAVSLPKPIYPAEARAARAGGAVNVQVTIDEQGTVVSANAVSGHELLRAAAAEAARNSKFAPTLLEGVPVIVTGVIVYNFVP